MKELLETIAKALVDEPRGVSVNVIRAATLDVYELRVADNDVRLIVGKGGRTADAIRLILNNASMKAKRRVALEIVESRSNGKGNSQ